MLINFTVLSNFQQYMNMQPSLHYQNFRLNECICEGISISKWTVLQRLYQTLCLFYQLVPGDFRSLIKVA